MKRRRKKSECDPQKTGNQKSQLKDEEVEQRLQKIEQNTTNNKTTDRENREDINKGNIKECQDIQ